MKKIKHKFLLEPILSSELILVNNAKLLKKDPSLLNEVHLDEIHNLRDEFTKLEEMDQDGLQKEKRTIRDRIKKLSVITYTNRDTNLFGQMITTMAQKIVTRPQFSNYTFKDEMQSLAIQHILLYTWKFDPYKKSDITGQYINAFAYISTIIFNAAIATINNFNKEQAKAKEGFLEHQKLIHRDVNASTYGPEYENAKNKIHLYNLKKDDLLVTMKSITIHEATEFWIPGDYKITSKEMDYILKYEHNISVRRLKTEASK